MADVSSFFHVVAPCPVVQRPSIRNGDSTAPRGVRTAALAGRKRLLVPRTRGRKAANEADASATTSNPVSEPEDRPEGRGTRGAVRRDDAGFPRPPGDARTESRRVRGSGRAGPVSCRGCRTMPAPSAGVDSTDRPYGDLAQDRSLPTCRRPGRLPQRNGFPKSRSTAVADARVISYSYCEYLGLSRDSCRFR